MNCLALDDGEGVVVIDCGTRFPTEDCGADVIHPDFSWLVEQRHRVLGVVLTHGHEDHIGALPFLLRELDAPVYGPAHALRLCRLRLQSHDFADDAVRMTQIVPGQRLQLGNFEFEPISVTHSIVAATALAIRSGSLTVLHTGDFKFDPQPSDGQLTDERRLEELGNDGVDLLLSDSTNIDETGKAGSEGEVEQHLLEVVGEAKARVFVALFASNIQRLISLGRVAERTGRRMCALGTSLVKHIEIARDLRLLDWPKDALLPPELIRTYPKRELLLLSSGTQAEPGSAMWRLAQDNHRFASVDAGDRVVFSSRIIPGNERGVVSMIGDLIRRGADVHWGRRTKVHTSGHACRDELQKMIELVRPRAFTPVHGTLHHLTRHAALARELQVKQVQVVENGQTLLLKEDALHPGERVHAGEVHVGFARERLDEEVRGLRKELGRNGHVAVTIVMDRKKRLVSLRVRQQGVAVLDSVDTRKRFRDALELEFGKLRSDDPEAEVERFTNKWLQTQLRVRPIVSATVVRVKEIG